MVKLLIIGIWACVTVGAAAYATISLDLFAPRPGPAEPGKSETVSLKQIGVPILSDNRLEGYLILRLAATVDADKRKTSVIKIEDLVADEVLRSGIGRSMARLPADIGELPEKVASEINRRGGAGLVQRIVVQDWNVIGKSEARK